MMRWASMLVQGIPGAATIEADRKAFAPYKQCVMESAQRFAKSTETIDNISAATKSVCRSKYAIASMDALDNVMDRNMGNPDKGRGELEGSNVNFATFEKMLAEDVAALVLNARTQ
ncbi:MAG: hypothetical protein EON58_02765 [Alphaproteobacteria bacterium]|nr:MAG: hypothetical protein EON58_02765 [Alphaproteobacteria bacterium]